MGQSNPSGDLATWPLLTGTMPSEEIPIISQLLDTGGWRSSHKPAVLPRKRPSHGAPDCDFQTGLIHPEAEADSG